MHDNLSGRAAELAHLNDLIRTSLSLADAAIPLLNEQLHALAEMGIDNLELDGPRIYSRTAGWSPAFDDDQIIYAVALTMPGGLGCTVWSADDYASRYGDSHHEPPVLRDRFVVYDKLPLSCSRRTWNLRGQGLAYPFPRRIPSHDPEA